MRHITRDLFRTRTRLRFATLAVGLLLAVGNTSLSGAGPAFAEGAQPNTAPVITEFPVPGASPFYPGLGPDGNIWAPGINNPIVRIATHAPNTVTLFPVHDDTYATDIITGPDGNMWFNEEGDSQTHFGKIGRILAHAPYTITDFTVETVPQPWPYQLVTGPDRNIYILESCSNGRPGYVACAGDSGGSVARITPFGSDARIQASVTHVASSGPCTFSSVPGPFPWLTCDTRLTGITVGPDRNLWLAGHSNVYRLTIPGYHLTRFPIPDGKQAFQITSGIDGNLWFTDSDSGSVPGSPSGNSIGRISPREPHSITFFPAALSPTNPKPKPMGITTGPDGKLWYGLPGDQAIGTLSPFAPDKDTEYPIAGSFVPGLVTGPCDNTIWFSDDGGHPAMGRIQLPGLRDHARVDVLFDLRSLLNWLGDPDGFGQPGLRCH